jgi:uncharacterized integral membrane protein
MARADVQEGAGLPVEKRRSLWQNIRMGGSIAAVLALALFLLQNTQSVEVNFLWFEWTTRMLWALLAAAAAGGIATFGFSTLRARRRRREERRKT